MYLNDKLCRSRHYISSSSNYTQPHPKISLDTLKFNWGFHSCGFGGEAKEKALCLREAGGRVSSRTKHFFADCLSRSS